MTLDVSTAFAVGTAWGFAVGIVLAWLWSASGRSDQLDDAEREAEQDATVTDIRARREAAGSVRTLRLMP